MSVIIISQGSYSHGREVAEKTAERLGYSCSSRDFLIEISKEFNIAEIKLTRALGGSPSILERYTFAREKYIAYMRAGVLEHLANDNAVFHGFVGHFFIKDLSHVLKVRIIAEMSSRVRSMMRREKISSPEEALKMVNDVDEERRKWSYKLYDLDTWDCRLYDLAIKVGKISIDDAVTTICDRVKKKAFQTTPESQRRMNNLLVEARQKLKEVSIKSPFFEPLRASPWRK